jgi:hypothetical protein
LALAIGYTVWGTGGGDDSAAAEAADAGTALAVAPPIDATERELEIPQPLTAAVDAGEPDARARKPPRDRKRDKPGYFSIKSDPYATIYIDGRRVDVTPLIKHPLSPGSHRVRAVLKDGRKKSFTIDIESGKQSPVRKLTW